MTESVSAFTAGVQTKLRQLKDLTDKSAKIEKQIAGAVRDIDKLRAEAALVASPQLGREMVKALGAVLRAADAVHEQVLNKDQYTPHQYRISLAELNGYLADKLDEAIHYFAKVERSNPSALRRSPSRRAISTPIDDSSGYAG